LLGRSSPTEDVEGEVTELNNPPIPTAEQIERALGALTGIIEQRPPAFSALKVAGRRAYDLARRGQAVTLAPRLVTVHRLNLIELCYPKLVLDIQCSAGTYVRSMGRDLAQSLGTAAVMSELVRTRVGRFSVEEAIDPRELTLPALREALQPPQAAVTELPAIALNDGQIEHLAHGRTLTAEAGPRVIREGALAVALDGRGAMAAIVKREAGNLLSPYINFVGK
jgi:tRNA pseudouridine55 synthase